MSNFYIAKHTPTRVFVLMESDDSIALQLVATALQVQYREKHKWARPGRLFTPDFPRFTVRDANDCLVFSAWHADCQLYKTE